MNTKLLALAYLLSKNCVPFSALKKELSRYTTERLFDFVAEVDKNPVFKPEYIFEIIEERGDYPWQHLFRYMNKVRGSAFNKNFKERLCTLLLLRNDYTAEDLLQLFCSSASNKETTDVLHVCFAFNKSLVQKKLASYSFPLLTEISEKAEFFPFVQKIAREAAKEKLRDALTVDLLKLLQKGTRIDVEEELARRTKELEKIACA